MTPWKEKSTEEDTRPKGHCVDGEKEQKKRHGEDSWRTQRPGNGAPIELPLGVFQTCATS